MLPIERANGYALAASQLWVWLAVSAGASLALILMLFIGLELDVSDQDFWKLWTRYTARVSFLLFLITYLAGPLSVITQTGLAAFLRRHRRNSGLSFAFLHTVHLAALIGYFVVIKEMPNLIVILGGGGAYVAMYAMTITSRDALIRRLGQTRWHQIHKFGIHYLAIIFAYSYWGRVAEDPGAIHVALAAMITGIMVLRFYLWKIRSD